MKKELLKGFTMLLLLVVIAFATAVVSTNAQSASGVRADIPFDFVVGNLAMPAGEYTFSKDSAPTNGLIIRNAEAKIAAILLTSVLQPKEDETRTRLRFHRYGDRYFLAEVWSGSDDPGRRLVKSRQERAIESELASISSKSDWVLSRYEIVGVAMHR